MRLMTEPKQPNYVHLAWAVRRVTPTQAKYIRMFYGEDALSAIVKRKAREADEAEDLAQSSSQA
jgi:CDP-diacylglycerol pyrophosphatase